MTYLEKGIAGFAAGLVLLGGSLGVAQQGKAAPPEPKVKVGDVAPDFTMTDQNGKEVSLRDFRGKKNVALAFYVFAFTGG